MRRWLAGLARIVVGMLLGVYLVYVPFAGWSLEPLVIVLVQVGLVAWYHWGEVRLARQSLPDEHAEVADAVGKVAALAGLPTPEVGFVEADAGEFTVPEALNLCGVVVFSDGDLAAHGMSHHVMQAARQLAVVQAPPAYSWPGLLATGAVLGGLLACRAVDPSSLWRSAVAGLGLLALVVGVVAISTNRTELRSRRIDDRAREIAGLARDRYPELFADLAARQGLGGDPDLIQLSDAPPRACDPGDDPTD